MSNLKPQVLDFLKNLPESPFDQFNQAFTFYRNSPRKLKMNEASYNRRGYSEQGLKNLIYDLKKAYEIEEIDIHSSSEPVEKAAIIVVGQGTIAEAFEKLTDAVKNSIFEAAILVTKFPDFIENSDELKEKVAFGTKEFEVFKNENIDLIFAENKDFSMYDALASKVEENPLFIESFGINVPGTLDSFSKGIGDTTGNTTSKVETLEVDAEAEASLREEFPFLNDDDCPQILYVVVGKRIAAYNKHKQLHAQLQDINDGKLEATEEEKKNITAECDAAFSDNRALWDELNHYGTTKEILGKHPVFREENIKKEVEAMDNEQLFNFINSSTKYFHDQRKKLEANKDNVEELAKINSAISDREYKLVLVKAKAGVKSKPEVKKQNTEKPANGAKVKAKANARKKK